MPNSLIYYVFYFKSLDDEDTNKYIETKIYLDIIYYLSSDMEEDKINYYEKAKNIAKHFTKCLFSQKLRIKDISKKDIHNIC